MSGEAEHEEVSNPPTNGIAKGSPKSTFATEAEQPEIKDQCLLQQWPRESS